MMHLCLRQWDRLNNFIYVKNTSDAAEQFALLILKLALPLGLLSFLLNSFAQRRLEC